MIKFEQKSKNSKIETTKSSAYRAQQKKHATLDLRVVGLSPTLDVEMTEINKLKKLTHKSIKII